MNWLPILTITFGIFYLIYSIMFRDKPTIYFKNLKIIKGKEDKYLKLQMYFSIFNSFIFITIGIIVAKNDLHYFYIMLTFLIFHLVNISIQEISKTRGYVES